MATIHITTPPTKEDIMRVKAGDEVLFSGRVLTVRDKAHRWLLKTDFKPMHNAVVYHCGPMFEKKGKEYTIIAAGPTTSARVNHYTPQLIEKYNIRAIIGKGGMDEGVRKALIKQGIYCAAIGGASVVYASHIVKVLNVYKTEFGMTDAIWELEVKDFPVVCMMDTKGSSLFQKVEKASTTIYKKQ